MSKVGFFIEDKVFSIEIETLELGPTTYVKLPIYDIEKINYNKKLREHFKNSSIYGNVSQKDLDWDRIGMINNYDLNYFKEDLLILKPEKLSELEGSLEEISQNCISRIVESHISRYGRIMRNDLDVYVVETIMLCRRILRYPYNFSQENKQMLYDKIFKYILHKHQNHYVHTDIIDPNQFENDPENDPYGLGI